MDLRRDSCANRGELRAQIQVFSKKVERPRGQGREEQVDADRADEERPGHRINSSLR
jgi:hypothetical protein